MAGDLVVESASTQIEVALRDTLALALRRRYPAEPNVAALRVRQTLGASGTSLLDETNVELVPVAGTPPAVYRWSATSAAADNGDTTIAPADRLTAHLPGRWLKTSAVLDGGFLDAVRLYEGEDTEELILDKVLGAVPSCLVVWRGEDHALKSVQPGALYEFPVDFEIWVSSRSLRSGNEALLGSPIADEAAADPGILNAIGRVKKVLAGSDLGIGPGVDYVQLGAHLPKLQSLSERQFVHALKIRVKASLHIPDAPGEDVPLDQGSGTSGLFLQPVLVEVGAAGTFDPTSYRVHGLDVDLGHLAAPGVTSVIHAGEVVIGGGVPIATAETVFDFGPNHDVYRDVLPNGVVQLSAFPIDAAPPPIAPGAIRVGVSRTNPTDVIADRFLIGTAQTVGAPDRVP